jgi:16S rRNA (guanine966-N2)-methyltransferase
VKKTLFAVLGESVRGASVLDLYAGAGVMGLEALSRDAARATFVESDARLAAAVEENVRVLGLSGAARVYTSDCLDYLTVTRPSTPYDVVFLDPPYGRGLVFRTVELLGSWPGFGIDSIGVAKTFKKEYFTGPSGLTLLSERLVGDDKLILFGRTQGTRAEPRPAEAGRVGM